MITFSLIRKIGRILRGGAGKKEIFLGVLCGVLIGFNPTASLTLVLAILVTLLLNANIGFALVGAAAGKALSLALAPLSFHTGYFLIHDTGLQELFAKLANAPGTALMDLNVYAMVGGLPYALVIGIVLGTLLAGTVNKIREKMLEAGERDKIALVARNKFTRFLLWLAFGKQKLSLEDVIAKQAPLFRKSGLILVGILVVLGLVLDFLLLDVVLKKGLQSAISAQTGAEVDVAKAHLSLTDGAIVVEGIQVTDPDKPTHNLVQLASFEADLSMGDLLRRTYAIDLLSGSTLKHDVPRSSPGKVFAKKTKPAEAEAPAEKAAGLALADYFAKAREWQGYGDKIEEFLQERKTGAQAAAKGEKPPASKEAAVADARKLGYLKAAADLIADRPAWTVHRVRIVDVDLGEGLPKQTFEATELSSHPELRRKITTLQLAGEGALVPTAKVVLRFDDPSALHALTLNIPGIALAGAGKDSADFPLDIAEGKADLKADGTFGTEKLDMPFTLAVHGLKAQAAAGRQVLGMDSATASEVFSSMEQFEVEGVVDGNLRSPRAKINAEKLAASMKQALVAAGKQELAKQADKAKEQAKQKATEELDKAMQSDEVKDAKSKASDALKKLF